MKKSFLSRFWDVFKKSAPKAHLLLLLLAVLLIAAGISEDSAEFIIIGIVMICLSAAAMIPEVLSLFIPGSGSDFVSDYDREVIGKAFASGEKKRLFYEGFELFRNDRNEDALEYFRELCNKSLTDRETGVLAFYTAICYNRLGFSTNAAHQAVIAADKDVQTAESLLMAARSFNMSASYSSAAEIYERLLPIAEERGIFPFLYNEMGKMYLSANDPVHSREAFEKAVEYGLDPVTAHGGLALVSLLEGKEDEACERYRLALIARINDTEGYKDYCAQICTANGYPENFFEEHLKAKYHRA
ncbi:MAG: tetratricopeptide repeat protein [Huintestinicola sp.]|uniref:tetratricopeptide repeat protein n=1 Tax=Huintestinicola sp. TaxID=2981661 RepID=UPI003F00C049